MMRQILFCLSLLLSTAFTNAAEVIPVNPIVAISRVAIRVSQDGHNIPEDVIRRRFKAGLHNFHSFYSKVVNSWAFYDSSGLQPKLIDWSNK